MGHRDAFRVTGKRTVGLMLFATGLAETAEGEASY
jgi:hypothetical protein